MSQQETQTWDWTEQCPKCGSRDCLDIHTEPPQWHVFLVCTKCWEQSKPRDITQSIRRMLVAQWRIALGLSVIFTPPMEGDSD